MEIVDIFVIVIDVTSNISRNSETNYAVCSRKSRTNVGAALECRSDDNWHHLFVMLCYKTYISIYTNIPVVFRGKQVQIPS